MKSQRKKARTNAHTSDFIAVIIESLPNVNSDAKKKETNHSHGTTTWSILSDKLPLM